MEFHFLPILWIFLIELWNFSGHPWLLFYTGQTLETSTFKSKTRNRVKLTSKQLTAITGVESERNKTIASSFLSDDSCLNSSSDSSSRRSEEQECGLVDALAVAISRVRISEPKRSRLCSPNSPIRQQCSSNMKLNNLCAAFWVGCINHNPLTQPPPVPIVGLLKITRFFCPFCNKKHLGLAVKKQG